MKFKKIYIEITNVCNLNCSFCIKHQRKAAFMDLSMFEHILTQIQPFTNYIYLHVMGEPLLHPDLKAFLLLAKEMGFYVNLTSNGTRLKQCKEVLQGNIRQLNLSLHSFPMENGCHSDDYIEQCLTIGDELAKHGTYISYRFWNQKQGRLDDESKQVLKMIFNHYQISETYQNVRLKPRRFLHFEEQFLWPCLTNPLISKQGKCYGLINHCAILVDGNVVPCCLDAQGDMILGNIMKQSMEEILFQPRVQKIIHGFHTSQCVEQLCQHCGYRVRFNGVKV